MNNVAPRVGMSTFGFLYRADLFRSLSCIAEAGYREVEIAPNPPHIQPTSASLSEVRAIRGHLEDLELSCVSINPLEMNLISPNPEIREVCKRTYLSAARMLAELGGQVMMVVPGRYNGLIPMPEPMAMNLFYEQLHLLLDEARKLDITLALETTPFGFLASTASILDVVHEIADPHLGIAVDVANIFPHEDVNASVRSAREHLKMVQFSGTWRDRWAHTSVDRGDLEFDDLVKVLKEIDYTGLSIYELVDGEDPVPRIGPGLLSLEELGWSR